MHGEVLPDEGYGGVRVSGVFATLADKVGAEPVAVDSAVDAEDASRGADGDLRCSGGKSEGFAQESAKLGEDVGDHGPASS